MSIRLNWPLSCILLAAALASCATGAYRVQMEMARANESVVRIPGKYPGVVIRNEGPGVLEVFLEAPVGVEAAQAVYLLQPGEELERRFARATTIRLRSGPDQPCVAEIETRDSTGLHIVSMPVPHG